MKKILLVALEYPPMVGGVEEYYRGLVEASGGHIIPFVGEKKLYWNFFPRWLPMLWCIPREMKRVGAEVVFAGEILPIGTALWLLHLFSSSLHLFISSSPIPYGVFLHGLDLALTGRKRWVAKKVMKNATWVVANSEYTKNIVRTYGIDPKKVTVLTPCPSVDVIANSKKKNVIPSPEPESRTQPIVDSRLRRNDSVWRLLTIARFVERKGYDTAVAVAAELKRQGKNFVWTFVGDGPDRDRVVALAEQFGVNDCVRFERSAHGEQLADFYRAADLFVFLPRELPNGDFEGFGMVYLEAGLFGLPVVASKSGGVPEAVIDGITGILTSPIDTLKITQDIIDFVEVPKKRQAIGMAGRERVLKDFRWEDRVQALGDILNEKWFSDASSYMIY